MRPFIHIGLDWIGYVSVRPSVCHKPVARDATLYSCAFAVSVHVRLQITLAVGIRRRHSFVPSLDVGTRTGQIAAVSYLLA